MKFLVTAKSIAAVMGFHLLVAGVQAQPAAEPPWPPAAVRILDGQILGSDLDRSLLEVELEDLEHRTVGQRVPVDAWGRFQFYGVAPGQYQVRVITRGGEVIRRDLIVIQPYGGPLEIRLPEREASRPVTGTVSLRRLRVSVPKQAVKEFRASVKAIESGGCGQAIAHLKRALEIEPQFFEAHNNLGSCYMKGKQSELALASFAEAHALDAGSAVLESNLAAALLALRRHAEAEDAARRALRLDRQLAGAHYLLGLSLTAQDRFSAEALANFREAYGQFPAARLPAAAILIQLGRATEAAQELRDYLRLGTPERRREVGAWLARLETSLGSTGGAYETRLPD